MLLLVAVAAFSGCRPLVRAVLAPVLSAEGEVFVRRGAFAWQPASAGTRLAAGDAARTGPGAKAVISCVPGALVELTGDSELEVIETWIAKRGNAMEDEITLRRARVRLRRGSVCASLVEAASAVATTLEIELPTGKLIASSGTLLRVTLEENTARATCIRGQIHTHTSGSELERTIEAGFFTADGKAPAAAAWTDANAQTDIAEALEAETRCTELATAAQDAPPPWR